MTTSMSITPVGTQLGASSALAGNLHLQAWIPSAENRVA
jgi:hypothetical protein